jgi:hypothetical protein
MRPVEYALLVLSSRRLVRPAPASARLTSLTLSCAAKARVPKPARRGGCDVRAALSGARK